jgi:hypothetical protein
MSGAARTLAGWGVVLLVAALAVLAFSGVDTETYALLFGLAGGVWVTASVLWWLGRRRSDTDEPGTVRLEPDLSLASGLLGLALFLLAVSAIVGIWLTLIAAGLLAAAVGGRVRERRAMRRRGET